LGQTLDLGTFFARPTDNNVDLEIGGKIAGFTCPKCGTQFEGTAKVRE